jgi:hypothetical protein
MLGIVFSILLSFQEKSPKFRYLRIEKKTTYKKSISKEKRKTKKGIA